MNAPAFELDRVAVQAGGRCLFSARQLHIPAGSLCAIIGPNGAGKTTLLRALAGFHGDCHGHSLGQPLRAGQPRPLAWVGQHEGADSPLSVADYVMLGRRPQLGWLGRSSAADQQAVARALDSMALQGLAGQRVHCRRLAPGQPHRRQHLYRLLACGQLARAALYQTERHIGRRVQVRKQRVVLEHHGDVALLRWQPGDVLPAQPHLTTSRALQAGHQRQQAGLALARRPQQGQRFASSHLQADALQHGAAGVKQRQVNQLEHGFSPATR